ncbi:DUF1631 family protein [Rhodanobacter sp. DHB23]|uniref:DUF1631 family protein n=1 Tax=Rhodanobacter sp. DHB23 TaxID=2775923 RepID=UPI001786A94B|nr:DUF1631 family protein [Rhodanobacter sp. DHB23]MBD8872780.1 DUF1631 family protein [Rhodanobacter sp. DHB23]
MDAEHRKPQATNATGGPIRPRWPARTQRLLNVIGPQCAQWLEPALQQCLDRFDKELYQMAEHARSHAAQQQCIDSRAQLQMQRPAFMQAYADHLRDGFARLGEVEESDDTARMHQPLRLLELSEHELLAALDKLAARGEAHHGQLLTELSYRFAVLVGAAPLEGAALPIGPVGLAEALRVAMGTLDLPSEHRQLLLQTFEQALITAAEPLYTVVNTLLLDDGLLPQLRPYAPPRPAPGARTTPGGETSASTGAENHGAPQAPITVLETLRDLLSQRRTGGGGGVAAGQAASPDELQTALGALQQHLAQVTDNASRELRSAQRLREELLLQLNAGKPAGAVPTRLSPEQDDTVELMAMLFEQLGKQLHEGPQARSVLGDLQLPMLRLAVTDRDFFDKQEHPARRLLGVVADAANDWLDGTDGDADQQLTARLNQLVERARREPPSAGLYTSLLADIEHHLAQLSRRAQTSERRHVEAMQGRERLDLARHRASELLAERYAENPPRGLLRTLLDRAWSDVLALAVLQHGEGSPLFMQRLRVTDELLGRLPTDDPGLLRREVQAGLQQIGMHAEEASQVALRLIGEGTVEATTATPPAAVPSPPGGAAARDTPAVETHAPATAAPPAHAAELPSATDLALRLKQRQRLGESTQGKHAATSDDGHEPPLGPQEARIHNRLRQLPYGSWFEFTDRATGQTSRRKLAWFSPVTGKSLFITRRGQRSEEMNLRDLARAMASGEVREMPAQRDGLLDRAWHSLTGSLLRTTRPSPAKQPGARP